jgi:hypothetical protein
MEAKRSLMKLLIGSAIAGIIIKYAAQLVGPGTDPIPLVGEFFRELIVNQSITTIGYAFFNVNNLLWLIIFLLIALVPFMFALFSGVWGFLTYLSGFLAGYLIVSGGLSFVIGIICLVLGIMAALYGQYIRG